MGEEMSDIPSWAVPGAKVVCVDASKGEISNASRLVVDGVYTLTDVTDEFREPACRVRENPSFHWEFIRLSRFRPLVTRTQEEDVAAFRHLLHDNKEPAYPT